MHKYWLQCIQSSNTSDPTIKIGSNRKVCFFKSKNRKLKCNGNNLSQSSIVLWRLSTNEGIWYIGHIWFLQFTHPLPYLVLTIYTSTSISGSYNLHIHLHIWFLQFTHPLPYLVLTIYTSTSISGSYNLHIPFQILIIVYVKLWTHGCFHPIL
jgi:hypothetical protein